MPPIAVCGLSLLYCHNHEHYRLRQNLDNTRAKAESKQVKLNELQPVSKRIP